MESFLGFGGALTSGEQPMVLQQRPVPGRVEKLN
jgi:hypothetical protein